MAKKEKLSDGSNYSEDVKKNTIAEKEKSENGKGNAVNKEEKAIVKKENKNITEKKEITVYQKENKKKEIAKIDEQKKDNKKKNKLTKEEIKLLKEKQAKRKAVKEKQYLDVYDSDTDLAFRRLKEEKEIKKSRKTAIILMCSVIGLPFGLYKFVKSSKRAKLLKNPFELQKIIIIEEALKKHNAKNKLILEAYKEEKTRIKKLKKLPFKVLNHINFLISMLLIILFFFVLDVGVEPTALVLFGSFCLMYFSIGLLMHLVFYMIAENKTRERLAKLEEDKNRLLAEEKLKSEAQLRMKIEKERRFFEEKERIRLEEERLRKMEIARREKEKEDLRLKIEEEARLEEERMYIKEEEKRKIAELEEEKKRIIQEKRTNLLKKLEKGQQAEYSIPKLSKAELASIKEALRNEFDKNLLEELNREFELPDVSGIENFADTEKLKKEYAAGIRFTNENKDDVEKVVNKEIDNSILNIVKRKDIESDEMIDFDITNQNPTATKTSLDEDLELEKMALEQSVGIPTKKVATSNLTSSQGNEKKGKPISGKSFMIIKEMLKDR